MFASREDRIFLTQWWVTLIRGQLSLDCAGAGLRHFPFPGCGPLPSHLRAGVPSVGRAPLSPSPQVAERSQGLKEESLSLGPFSAAPSLQDPSLNPSCFGGPEP